MTNQWLLVAEVDKIQSFIFRSSKLKEVVGASYILTKFCEDVSKNPKKLIPENAPHRHPPKVLTSGGGSFRLIYKDYDERQIEEAKRKMKRLFDKKVGGSITIASVPYNDATPESSEESLEAGRLELIKAKQKGRSPAVVWHMPYHAICASCGVELATIHKRQFDDEPEKYICELCLKKADKARPKFRRECSLRC